MSAKFFALLTVIGANKLAKATALGTTLKITQMAVGDGGGTLPMPSAEQTKLVNEKRRAGINTLFIDSKNANQIVAEQVIPENEGGYWIREIGLFDDEGSLIAVGNCPETYKPQLQEGSGRTQTIRMILTVSHTESVELKVDPSVILATRESVDNAIEIASKSILDTVEKEYATKDEVKKKFDNRNIVHEKGASKEKVISQKGVTELFQPKGNYQPAGNYVTTATFNLEINKKIDKASLSQQLGNDVNKVPSLDLVTKELGKKLDKSKISQAVGVSPDHVMSQKACVDNFAQNKNFEATSYGEGRVWSGDKKVYLFTNNNQNSGLYSTEKEGYIWGFNANGDMLGGRVPVNCGGTGARDVATAQSNLQVYSKTYINTELNKKFDKTKISQGIGPSTEHVMSQKACVDTFQPKGNYLDKSSTSEQSVNGTLVVKDGLYSRNPETGEQIGLSVQKNKHTIFIVGKDGAWSQLYLPIRKKEYLATLQDIDSATNTPVGSPIPWSLPTAPSGYLICNGQTFNKSTYPKLAVAYPSGKLPDLRGEFIRGLDSGRGIDAGRSVLSAQKGNSLLSSNIFGGLSSSESNKWHKAINYIGITGTDNDGGYGVHQQIEGANGNETRPRNIAFLYIVRAA
ncbi:hypothetical protein C6A90_08605 [Proteus mirabilis]|uniref:phage tail-collar fiber domain-containing protein n=4 Tax=Proteus mirabilis TaxID=584 RepID=UPI000DE9446A|nr:phage tail protein [Proteus mirabilis]RCE53555.1 hypothetical protein C6A90_08605 [Proteus mirabilis]